MGITDKKMEPYCSFSLSSPACESISLAMSTKSKTENGLGFRVQGLEFRGLEFRVQGLSRDVPAWESINIMPLDSRLPRGIPHDPSCNSIQVLGAPIAKLDPPPSPICCSLWQRQPTPRAITETMHEKPCMAKMASCQRCGNPQLLGKADQMQLSSTLSTAP